MVVVKLKKHSVRIDHTLLVEPGGKNLVLQEVLVSAANAVGEDNGGTQGQNLTKDK
jgi:hypothetical protein